MKTIPNFENLHKQFKALKGKVVSANDENFNLEELYTLISLADDIRTLVDNLITDKVSMLVSQCKTCKDIQCFSYETIADDLRPTDEFYPF